MNRYSTSARTTANRLSNALAEVPPLKKEVAATAAVVDACAGECPDCVNRFAASDEVDDDPRLAANGPETAADRRAEKQPAQNKKSSKIRSSSARSFKLGSFWIGYDDDLFGLFASHFSNAVFVLFPRLK